MKTRVIQNEPDSGDEPDPATSTQDKAQPPQHADPPGSPASQSKRPARTSPRATPGA